MVPRRSRGGQRLSIPPDDRLTPFTRHQFSIQSTSHHPKPSKAPPSHLFAASNNTSSSMDQQQYNRAVAHLQEVIALKNERMLAKDDELSKLNREIKEKQQDIDVRDAALLTQKEFLTNTHKMKDGEISMLNFEIKHKDQAIENRDMALLAQKQVIADTHKILATQQDKIKALTVGREDQKKREKTKLIHGTTQIFNILETLCERCSRPLIDSSTQISDIDEIFCDHGSQLKESATDQVEETSMAISEVKSENMNKVLADEETPAENNGENDLDTNTNTEARGSCEGEVVATETVDPPQKKRRRRPRKQKKKAEGEEVTVQANPYSLTSQEVIPQVPTAPTGKNEKELEARDRADSLTNVDREALFAVKETMKSTMQSITNCFQEFADHSNLQLDFLNRTGPFSYGTGITCDKTNSENHEIAPLSSSKEDMPDNEHEKDRAQHRNASLKRESTTEVRSSLTNDQEDTKHETDGDANNNTEDRRKAAEWNWGGTAKFLSLLDKAAESDEPRALLKRAKWMVGFLAEKIESLEVELSQTRYDSEMVEYLEMELSKTKDHLEVLSKGAVKSNIRELEAHKERVELLDKLRKVRAELGVAQSKISELVAAGILMDPKDLD